MKRGLHGALAATAFFLSLIGGAARAQPPLWVVKSGETTMILFGSLHVLPPRLDWVPKTLADGLARSDEVWFELPMDAATEARVGELARARGMLKPGDRLSAHLKPVEIDRLDKDAAIVGVAPRSLEPLRPWLADVVLSLALDGKSGASGAYGVEARVQALTPRTTRRRAFETAEEQIDILAGASMSDQTANLDSTLDDIEDKDNIYDRLLKAWMSGDVAGLQHEVLDPLRTRTPDLYARLISDRNHRWVATLKERLKQGGTVVVVVGLGHLIGPDGVPAALRAQGVAVDGP